MPVPVSTIQDLIQKALPDAKIEVIDLVGDGDHLQATVISESFAGKGLLAQHQMVYAPLRETLKDQLHALALKTYSPEQWAKLKK